MSHHDQSEIINNLNILLNKNADIAETIGEGAAFEGGIQVAKKVLPWIASTLGAGAGAAGLLTILSNPITLGVLGVAATSGIIYAIYKNHKYKDSIDEAIENMKTLDPNHKIENIINSWISQLTKYSDALVMPAPTDDPKEAAINNKNYLLTLGAAQKLISNIVNVWQKDIAPNLEDLGTDSQDTYVALNKSLVEINAAIEDGKQRSSKLTTERIQQISKNQKTDYNQVAKNVVNNYNMIKELTGEEPELTDVENKAFELATSMLSGTVSQEDFNSYYKNMIKLNKDLVIGIKQLKNRKTSSLMLSKRALKIKLPGGSYLDVTKTREKNIKQPNKEVIKTNPIISEIQDTLNDLFVMIGVNANRLSVNGIWDENTESALIQLMSIGKISSLFNHVGISPNVIKDPGFVQSKYLGRTLNILRGLLDKLSENNQETGAANAIENTKNSENSENIGCNLDKVNPNSAEILSCLHSRSAVDPATKESVNLYELGIYNGLNEDQMVRYIHDHFRGRSSRTWDTQEIMRDWGGKGRRGLY